MCWLSINLWASTSWNPKGLSRPVMGLLYLYGYLICFNAQEVFVLPTQCIYVFSEKKSFHFPKQYKPFSVCNRDTVFSVRYEQNICMLFSSKSGPTVLTPLYGLLCYLCWQLALAVWRVTARYRHTALWQLALAVWRVTARYRHTALWQLELAVWRVTARYRHTALWHNVVRPSVLRKLQ
jgi:hypothetical protein